MSKYFLIFSILIFLGCSSIPKQQFSQATQKSVQLVEQGSREEARNNLADALTSYLQSLHYATLNGDVANQLAAMQGCLRVYYNLADSVKVQLLLKDMQEIIEHSSASYHVYLIQSQNWINMQKSEYQKVYDNAIDDPGYKPELSILLLSDKIQAAAKLRIIDKSLFSRLQSLTSRYIRTSKKKQGYRTDIVAHSYYSLAYYLASTQKWAQAVKFVDRSIKIDKTSDVYINLADDYLLKGKCLIKLNQYKAAIFNLWEAKKIYSELNLHQIADSTDKLIKQVKIIMQESKVKIPDEF